MMPIINMLAALALAPLLMGVINRTKAIFAGRRGSPMLQMYFDLAKLMRKGAVYSESSSWVFRAGPIVSLAAVIGAMAIVPMGSTRGIVSFDGDIFLFAYLMGLMRFVTVLSALDTGSSFEGMGASREVQFAALAEPVFLLAFAALAWAGHSRSLVDILSGVSGQAWSDNVAEVTLAFAALFVVFLTENSRLPIDDPSTHLELTMIHEVMVLDHSGVDLAFIHYGAALKLWALGALVVGVLLPHDGSPRWLDGALFLVAMGALAALTGVVESSMARLRLRHVPQLLIGAGALSFFALILVLR